MVVEEKLYYAHPWNWYWRSNFIDGELYRGHSFSAGEWGNMLIEGKTFEENASISGLIRLVRKYKDESDWNGKRFSNCMIKVIGRLPKQLRCSLNI